MDITSLSTNTVPVVIKQGEAEFTLHILANLLSPLRAKIRANEKSIVDIEREKQAIRAETDAMLTATKDEDSGEVDTEGKPIILKAQKHTDEELIKVTEEAVAKIEKLDEKIHGKNCERLAMIVTGTSFTKDGQPVEVNAELFKTYFDPTMVQHCFIKIAEKLSNPFFTDSGDSSAG